MKRYLLIELITGEKIEKDLKPTIDEIATKEGVAILSATVDNPFFQLMAAEIASKGMCKPGTAQAGQPHWIAPSQIKSVDVVFDTTMFANHKPFMP